MSSKQLVDYLAILLISISFWLFIATTPPLRIGIWIDSEFVLVAANVLFAAIGLSLSALCIVKKRLLFSTQTICFCAVALLSFLATAWAKNKTLHHFGVPLLGEGTALFCGLSLLSLAYDNIVINNAIRLSAIGAGLVAGLLVALHHPAHGFNINPDWLPYVFGAFLAPIALGIYIASEPFKNNIIKTTLILFSILLLYLSHNKTAWVAVGLSFVLWAVTYYLKNHNKFIKITCLSIPLLSLISTCYLASFSSFGTLESRKLAVQSYFSAWKDAPQRLLYGHGWGYYFENLQKQITQLPVKFFEGQIWQPSWDGIERLDFHCMHFGIEILFSIGVVGLVIYLTLVLVPLVNLKEQPFNKLLFVVLFAALTSTWFNLVCVWPFLVFGFAALNQPVFTIKKPYLLATIITMAGLCCGHAALTYWNTAILYPTNQNSWLKRFTYSNDYPKEKKIKTHYNYNGLHLGHFLLSLTKKTNYLSFQTLEHEFLRLFKVYDAKSSPLVLDVAMLHALQYFADNKQPFFDLWEQAAQAVLQKAPKRTDLVVPFIKELIEQQQLVKAKQFIDLIHQQNQDNPFGIWLEGIYYIQQKEIAKGKKLMQFALSQGIEKWIFIPQKLQYQLK